VAAVRAPARIRQPLLCDFGYLHDAGTGAGEGTAPGEHVHGISADCPTLLVLQIGVNRYAETRRMPSMPDGNRIKLIIGPACYAGT